MNELENKYKDYVSRQCSNSKNIANPSLCPSAKTYVQGLKSFISQTKTEGNFASPSTSTLDESGYPSVWPQVNHDFDMRMYAKLKYNPYAMGITNEPTVSNLVQSPISMMKYMSAMSSAPLMDKNTQAGVSDRVSVNVPSSSGLPYPYPSFRQDFPECQYPTSGEYSASYFVRTGMTAVPSVKDPTSCIQQGFQWQDEAQNTGSMSNFVKLAPSPSSTAAPTAQGICYKPIYTYINAQLVPGSGLVPSMFYDLEDAGKRFV